MRNNIEALFQTNNLAELKKLNYYELFSVDKELSNEDLTREINSKFRQLALRFHPDQTNGDAQKAEIFKLINEAHSVLLDSQKRLSYDLKLSESDNAEPSFQEVSRFFSANRNNPAVQRTFDELHEEMRKDMEERDAEEAKTERVVKAFLIVGGDDSERQNALNHLIAEHHNTKGMGKLYVGSTPKEAREAEFSEYAIPFTYSEGDYSTNSFVPVVFSNGEILRCHLGKDFVKDLAKEQNNIITLTVQSGCCCAM